MLRRPLIVGVRGGMGRRYASILAHLSIKWEGIDEGDEIPERKAFDSVLIASPTRLHVEHCRKFARYDVPILVEKPLSKDVSEALALVDELDGNVPIRMVNQYRHMGRFSLEAPSHYDYFKSGTDGVAWDCISILGLAKARVRLANTSPFWDCTINGTTLRLDKMDEAYVVMVSSWLLGDVNDPEYIRHAHRRVAQYLETGC